MRKLWIHREVNSEFYTILAIFTNRKSILVLVKYGILRSFHKCPRRTVSILLSDGIISVAGMTNQIDSWMECLFLVKNVKSWNLKPAYSENWENKIMQFQCYNSSLFLPSIFHFATFFVHFVVTSQPS
jgi:hypothetical protein